MGYCFTRILEGLQLSLSVIFNTRKKQLVDWQNMMRSKAVFISYSIIVMRKAGNDEKGLRP